MNVHDFKKMKQTQQKICMLTCYDYPSARIIADTHIDCVLVGDSVAMVVHGHSNTIMATMGMMELHTQAVARGLNKQFITSDIPFLGHKKSLSTTVQNASRLLQAGAHAIKIEGADADTCQTISHLVNAGVPVMGHIGLTPQFIHQLGGFRVQGRSQEQKELLIKYALKLEQAGCFALVIECVPSEVGEAVCDAVDIPVIGIGAGHKVDGQVLVWHDLLGMQTEINPKFVKRYLQGKELLVSAINDYVEQVQGALFPSNEHCF